MSRLLRRRRYRGRHHPGTVNLTPAVDPWAGAPLFCADLERQAFAAELVLRGRL